MAVIDGAAVLQATATAVAYARLGFILDSNTEALWTFNQTGSTITDRSAYGHNLTLTGTAASVATPLELGRETGPSAAIGFSGTNYFSVAVDAATDSRMLGDITFEAWVKPSAILGYFPIISYLPGFGVPGGDPLGQMSISEGKFTALSNSDGYVDTRNVALGRYTYVVMRRRIVSGLAYVDAFINGTLIGTSPGFTPAVAGSGARSFWVGTNGRHNVTIAGVIDEMRLSNVARSDAEIETSYARAANPVSGAASAPATGTATNTATRIGTTAAAAGHVLDASTFALWRFDDNSLTNVAEEKGLYPATGTAIAVQNPGKIGLGLYFNQDTEMSVEGTDSAFRTLVAGNNWTFEFWLIQSFPHRLGAVINYHYSLLDDSGVSSFAFGHHSDSYFLVGGSSGVSSIASSTGHQNVWRHFAITKTSSLYTLFIDGVQVGTLTNAAPTQPAPTSTAKWKFSRGPGSARGHGVLDDARVSNVVRSSSEIMASYLAGAPPVVWNVDGATTVAGAGGVTATALVNVLAQGAANLTATVTCTGTASITLNPNLEFFNFDGVETRDELSLGERRIRRPFTGYPTLEEFRKRALQAVSGAASLNSRGRAVVMFAAHTELRTVFNTLMDLSLYTLVGHLSDKRKGITVDGDLIILKGLYERALRELSALNLPSQYQDLLRIRLNSSSFNHRVSAVCAVVWLTAILLNDDQSEEALPVLYVNAASSVSVTMSTTAAGNVVAAGGGVCTLSNWASAQPMATARTLGNVTALGNTDVLISGGTAGFVAGIANAERYNSVTWAKSAAGTMATPRYEAQAATFLEWPNDVLSVGGVADDYLASAKADRYVAATNTWTAVVDAPNTVYRSRIVALDNPRIMVAGGTVDADSFFPKVNRVLAYNGSTGTWATLAAMATARDQFALIRYNGNILAIGGEVGAFPGASTVLCEKYTVSTSSWSSFTSLPTARSACAAVVLNDNRILVASDGTYTIYDNGVWSADAALPSGLTISRPSMFLMASGYVTLIANNNQVFSFNPTTNVWTLNAVEVPATATIIPEMTAYAGACSLVVANDGTTNVFVTDDTGYVP